MLLISKFLGLGGKVLVWYSQHIHEGELDLCMKVLVRNTRKYCGWDRGTMSLWKHRDVWWRVVVRGRLFIYIWGLHLHMCTTSGVVHNVFMFLMVSSASCVLCHDYFIFLATLLIWFHSNLCFVNEKSLENFSRHLLSSECHVRPSRWLTLLLTQLWWREGEPGPHWNWVREACSIFLKHLCCFWWAVGRVSFKAHFKDHLVHQIIPDIWGRRGLCSYLYTIFSLINTLSLMFKDFLFSFL